MFDLKINHIGSIWASKGFKYYTLGSLWTSDHESYSSLKDDKNNFRNQQQKIYIRIHDQCLKFKSVLLQIPNLQHDIEYSSMNQKYIPVLPFKKHAPLKWPPANAVSFYNQNKIAPVFIQNKPCKIRKWKNQ